LDDVCVKVNGLVGFMLDVDRDEVLFMRFIIKYSYKQFIGVKLLYWRQYLLLIMLWLNMH